MNYFKQYLVVVPNNKLSFRDTAGQSHTTTLLSRTHDMGCYSWSIPAGHSCPSAVYGAGTICESCYALINRYGMDNVADAQWIRYVWTKHCLKHDPQLWIDTMAVNIIKVCTSGKHATPYFRWHDSGDLFSVAYIDAIRQVCEQTPEIDHWIPTRGWQVKRKPIAHPYDGSVYRAIGWHQSLQCLADRPNVCVRSSALDFNSPAPSTPYGPGSSAYDDSASVSDGMVTLDGARHHACPKSTTDGGTCAACNCRRCWDTDGGDVAYYVHGWQGRHTAGHLSDAGQAKRTERKARFTGITISA